MISPDRHLKVKFFLEHSGYSTPPGRVKCAMDLAMAEEAKEVFLREEKIKLEWVDDEDCDLSWDETGWFLRRLENGTASVKGLILKRKCNSCGCYENLDSLWGISMIDEQEATDMRVFEAQMILENINELS